MVECRIADGSQYTKQGVPSVWYYSIWIGGNLKYCTAVCKRRTPDNQQPTTADDFWCVSACLCVKLQSIVMEEKRHTQLERSGVDGRRRSPMVHTWPAWNTRPLPNSSSTSTCVFVFGWRREGFNHPRETFVIRIHSKIMIVKKRNNENIIFVICKIHANLSLDIRELGTIWIS